MVCAICGLIPGTLINSDTLAFLTSCNPPRYCNNALRRFGPMPGIDSNVDVLRVFCLLFLCPVMANR